MNLDHQLRLAHVRFNVRWTSSFTASGILGAWLMYKLGDMDLLVFYVMVPLGALTGLITVWPMWAMMIKDLTIIKLQNEDKLKNADDKRRMEFAPAVPERDMDFDQKFRLARVRFYVMWTSVYTAGGILIAWMLYPQLDMDLIGFYVLMPIGALTGLLTAWPMWAMMIRDLTIIRLQTEAKLQDGTKN